MKLFNQTIKLKPVLNVFVPGNTLNEWDVALLQAVLDSELTSVDFNPNLSLENQKKQLDKLDFSDKIYYIYTTNPALIPCLPKETVIWRIDKEDTEWDKIEQFDSDFHENLTVQIIATSPIFNFETLFREDIDLNKLRTENSYMEMLHTDWLDRNLKDIAQRKEDRFNQLFNNKNDKAITT